LVSLELGTENQAMCEFIFASKNEYSLDFLLLLGQAKSKEKESILVIESNSN